MSDELTYNEVLTPKRPNDDYTIGIEWARILPAGVTLSSVSLISVEPDDVAGDDVTLDVDDPTIVGTRTLAMTHDGTPDIDYTITLRAVWSDSQSRERSVILPVRSS